MMRLTPNALILGLSVLLAACGGQEATDLPAPTGLPPTATAVTEQAQPTEPPPQQEVEQVAIRFAVFDWERSLYENLIQAFEEANPDIDVQPVYQVPPGEPRWIVAVLSACAEVRLFEQIAIEAGVDLTNETFAAAAERLGDVEVPGTFAASLGIGKYDADDAVRLVVWDSTVGANGGIRSISELLVVD